MATAPSLQQLLQRPDIWRHRDARHIDRARGHATGFAALDRELQGGGWPRGALSELLLARAGIGELFLLAPALAALREKQLLHVWINPPFIPYAPALVQRGIDLDTLLIVRGDSRHHLWACEQALRSSACGALLYWPAKNVRYAELRKLQVAAATQTALGFLFRDARALPQASPAALRLALDAADTQLSVNIVKQRGRERGQTLLLPRESFLHAAPAFDAELSVDSPPGLKIVAARAYKTATPIAITPLSIAAARQRV